MKRATRTAFVFLAGGLAFLGGAYWYSRRLYREE